MKKVSGSTRIRTPGLNNTVPALYHWASEPHVDLPNDISPNTCSRLHSYTFTSAHGIDQYTTYFPAIYGDSSTNPPITQFSDLFTLGTNITGGEKISVSTGIWTPGLRNTVPTLPQLPNHMWICLTIYHQIPVPNYIAIHLHLSMEYRGYLFFFFQLKIEIYFIEWTPSVFTSGEARSENFTDGVHEMK